MAENLVSKPPLQVALVDKNGLMSRAWAVFFRDLYNRVAYKGGNAIDEGNAAINAELVDTNASLTQTITVVNANVAAIASGVLATNANTVAIEANTAADLAHTSSDTQHGSNGKIVGFDDLSTEALNGLVKRMALVVDGVATTVNIVTADITTAPATYSQSHSQSLADLANENKAAINQLATDLNAAIIVLNNLIAASKAAGQMTP